MNATLPRTPVVARVNALLATAVITLATLGAIDRLAAVEGAASLFARAAAARSA